MGYYQHSHENWSEYVAHAGVVRACDFCGGEFTPNSPNQRRHRRNPESQGEGEYLEAAACEDEQWKASLGRAAWVRLVTSYTVKEFIEIYGRGEYLSL